jgi:HAD superfamily hydrolase (TIGR01509 family)
MTEEADNLNSDIKVIIFDWDGCLFNNVAAMKAATEDTLKRYSIDYDHEEALAEATRLIEDLRSHRFTRLILNSYKMLEDVKFLEGFEFLKRLEIVFNAYTLYKEYSKQSRLFEGVIELLEKLSIKYKLAILTSGSRVDTSELMREFKVDRFFSKLVSADDVEKTKPDPEGIEKILAEFNLLPSQAIYLGDLPLDMKPGKFLGCNTYAVSTGLVTIDDLQKENPDKIFRHVTELATVLPGIERIDIDIEADLTREIEDRKKIIPPEEKEEFSISEFIKEITVEDFKEFLRNPYVFIREKISELLEKQETSSESIKDSLSIFEGFEHDLIQSLGYLILHIANSRLGNIVGKLVESDGTAAFLTLGFDMLKVNILTLYPGDLFELFLRALVSSVRDLLPDKVVLNLNEFSGIAFIEDILEGIRIALMDLGLTKTSFKEYLMARLDLEENKGFNTLYEIVMIAIKLSLAAFSIPMKVIVKRSLPLLTDTLEVTRETISSTLDTVDFSVFDDKEGLNSISDLISEVFDKFQGKKEERSSDTTTD